MRFPSCFFHIEKGERRGTLRWIIMIIYIYIYILVCGTAFSFSDERGRGDVLYLFSPFFIYF